MGPKTAFFGFTKVFLSSLNTGFNALRIQFQFRFSSFQCLFVSNFELLFQKPVLSRYDLFINLFLFIILGSDNEKKFFLSNSCSVLTELMTVFNNLNIEEFIEPESHRIRHFSHYLEN
jgi:hypothetical protein